MEKFTESTTPRYAETIFKALIGRKKSEDWQRILDFSKSLSKQMGYIFQKVEGDRLSEGTWEFGSVRIHFLDSLD